MPDPEPGALDVVVRVEACASTGSTPCSATVGTSCPVFTYPHIAGMDVAGTVVSIGGGVTDVAVGQRVVVDPSLAGCRRGLEARRPRRLSTASSA